MLFEDFRSCTVDLFPEAASLISSRSKEDFQCSPMGCNQWVPVASLYLSSQIWIRFGGRRCPKNSDGISPMPSPADPYPQRGHG